MPEAYLKGFGYLFFFAGLLGIIYSLIPKERDKRIKAKFGKEEIEIGENAMFVNAFRPFFSIFLPLIKRIPASKYKEKVEKFAITAGMEKDISGDDFIGFQITLSILFAVMTAVIVDGAIFIFLGTVVGGIYPYWWLYEKRKERQEKILSSMPDTIDMLSLSVEAGLEFSSAIKKICDIYLADKDPFVEELYLMNRNMQLGRTREEALKVMAERVDLQQLYSFTSILVQADKMGAKISDTLKSQAVRMRQERFMRAERMGAIASQKLMIPMILFIFPIIFIIIFGPYILKYIFNVEG